MFTTRKFNAIISAKVYVKQRLRLPQYEIGKVKLNMMLTGTFWMQKTHMYPKYSTRTDWKQPIQSLKFTKLDFKTFDKTMITLVSNIGSESLCERVFNILVQVNVFHSNVFHSNPQFFLILRLTPTPTPLDNQLVTVQQIQPVRRHLMLIDAERWREGYTTSLCGSLWDCHGVRCGWGKMWPN